MGGNTGTGADTGGKVFPATPGAAEIGGGSDVVAGVVVREGGNSRRVIPEPGSGARWMALVV